MSSFTSLLKVSPLPDGRNWKLLKKFTYHLGSKYSRHWIKVPKGFITDFASTDILQGVAIGLAVLYAGLLWILPNWVGLLFVASILLALLITPYGKQSKAAVLHDWLYNVKQIMGKPITRKQADRVFREAMVVGKTPEWKTNLMYYGVRLFGWFVWHQEEVKNDLSNL